MSVDLGGLEDLSVAQRIATLPPAEREKIMSGIDPEEFLHDWSSWRRRSQTPPPGDWSTWLFMAGRGCIAADTEIDLADGSTVRVDEACRAGAPLTVLSLHDDGTVKPVYAEAPFLKGHADIWTVTLEDGRSIAVTDQHRFLTPQGWATLSSVGMGSVIASASPTALPAGAQRSTRTAEDSMDRCSPGHRRYDQQLLQDQGTDQGSIPSRADVHGRIPDDSRTDVRAFLSASTHLYPDVYYADHRSKNSYDQDGLSREAVGYQQRPSLHGSYPQGFRDGRTYRELTSLAPETREPLRSGRGVSVSPPTAGASIWESSSSHEVQFQPFVAGDLSSVGTHLPRSQDPSEGHHPGRQRSIHRSKVSGLPSRELSHMFGADGSRSVEILRTSQQFAGDESQRYMQQLVPQQADRVAFDPSPQWLADVDDLTWTRVVSVERRGFEPYFDLHVPGTENYSAHGMINHNSGKTKAASEWIHERVRNNLAQRILLLGRTAADVRDVMIHGNALALDTVVPTPTGWTTMGAIETGDMVLGGNGKPCRVEEAYEVLNGRTCYRVTFKSGATVIADADHKWVTWDAKARKKRPTGRTKESLGVVRTTKEIADSFWAGGHAGHAVDVVGAAYDQHDPIPIDPYMFGVWLGASDGKSSGILLEGEDAEQILTQAGRFYEIFPREYSDGRGGGWTVNRLKGQLKDEGLLREKHIPVKYLRMISSSRLALLQGIMDTAGTIDPTGGCHITVASPRLRDEVVELLASLRIVATDATTAPLVKTNASSRVVKGAETYRILFRTTVPVTTIERNLDRLTRNPDEVHWYDYIASVNKIQPVPVRCIRVDSPDHLFLVTHRYIPTHNSGLLNTGRPDERPEYFPSKRLVVWPNGAEALLLSADEPDQARGPQADTAWCIAGNAKVITHRGWIPISEVRVGDQVMTRQNWKTVDATRQMGIKPVIQITTSTGTLRCTPDHRIWTMRHGWIDAGELPVGEILREPNGNGIAVISVDIGGDAMCYDLTVHDAHEFYADGILVKNCDEFASFPGMAGTDGATAFDNLRLGLRLPVPGDQPRMILTTTPRRSKVMFDLLKQAEDPKFGIVITRGTTYENLGNLADSFRATILGLYEGTRLGHQELMGEMLTDIEGALFMQEWFDAHRVVELPASRMYSVVGVDPSVAERPADECGIVVVKSTMEKDFYKRHVYICEDASVKGSPDIWSARVAAMSRKWNAPIVAEGNQGGELVRMAIAQADSNLPVHIVHARAGKAMRAEPVAAALQQGRVHMVGWHPELEDQCTSWIPSESRYSPDHLDAMVWGVLSVLTKQKGVSFTLGRHLRARSSKGRLPALNSALFAGRNSSGRR